MRKNYLVWTLLGLMSLLSMFRLIRIFVITSSPTGDRDFYSFWYSGQFIRQGEDPYRASLENLQPKVPKWYLVGKVSPYQPPKG